MKRVIHLLAAMVTIGLLGTGDGLLGENQGAEAQADSRPNFVFVVTDDLDERAMEQLGGIRVVMGTNGTTFENAYVTFSLCCPSRATMLPDQARRQVHEQLQRPLQASRLGRMVRNDGRSLESQRSSDRQDER